MVRNLRGHDRGSAGLLTLCQEISIADSSHAGRPQKSRFILGGEEKMPWLQNARFCEGGITSGKNILARRSFYYNPSYIGASPQSVPIPKSFGDFHVLVTDPIRSYRDFATGRKMSTGDLISLPGDPSITRLGRSSFRGLNSTSFLYTIIAGPAIRDKTKNTPLKRTAGRTVISKVLQLS